MDVIARLRTENGRHKKYQVKATVLVNASPNGVTGHRSSELPLRKRQQKVR